ncbi:PTS lactose/cellobiose transporter subunit IIA [Lactobacillus sp. ESL0684]|uniref:PTS lactose/cellobiose transporter subunit IIA n=1 Tax=Lactobacillus sp. ESL0684 TaxID=2983213 RepID=UPI0023F99DD8|nr:PTS lactose/cellobiose transporter subunit IIA [Lactobacillus sp. ESL0684]WEV44312.1 PTS lactose/cellobiose transporter subunit IIA [Lactobacillus sp. ESL0684]
MAEEQMQTTMQLIINAGNAKSCAMEAISAAKNQEFATADTKLDEAQTALNEAHNVQTKMLTEEAQGNHTEISLLMVHSQDHLMTAITFIDLAKELVDLYRKIA